jgi:hypothetical protein
MDDRWIFLRLNILNKLPRLLKLILIRILNRNSIWIIINYLRIIINLRNIINIL